MSQGVTWKYVATPRMASTAACKPFGERPVSPRFLLLKLQFQLRIFFRTMRPFNSLAQRLPKTRRRCTERIACRYY